MRILVKRWIALGDVIWTTPMVRALRQADPAAAITVSTKYPEVFARNPWVAGVLPPLCDEAGFDRVIDLNGAYERRRPLHVLAAYAAQAGLAVADPRPALFPAAADFAPLRQAIAAKDWPGRGIRRIVAVHMAANSPDRIWPQRHWTALLLALLADPGIGIVALGNGRDFDLSLDGAPDHLAGRVVSLVRRTAVLETAAAVALADLLVAPDSGVSHMAPAVGTRAVVLYGMTDPSRYLPFGGGSEGLWTTAECRGCIQDLPAEQPPLCRLGAAHCYDLIPPDAVLEAAKRALSGLVAGPDWRQRLALFG